MPKNAEEKWFPAWNPTHPDYQSSLGEENKNNFRQAQNKCIILQCWRSEVWNGAHWAKVSQQGCLPSGGSRGSGTLPLASPAMEAACIPGLVTSASIIFKASAQHLQMSLLVRPFCLPLTRTLWLHWAHMDNPGKYPHLDILNTAIKSLSTGEVTYLTGPRD